MFLECRWMNKMMDCKELFAPTLSDEGVCFTFNMLDREELFTNAVYQNRDFLRHGIKSTNWSLEAGYSKHSGTDAFPRRAISAGSRAGLYVLLRSREEDLDYVCNGPVQGFKILLHHPAEVPRLSQQYFRASLNQEIVVAVKPDMMTTSDGLRGYSPHKRPCYFSNERQLRFYRIYTQQNCEAECLTNYTYQQCGCVSYHMPHDEYTPLCGSGNTACAVNAAISLFMDEAEKSLDDDEGGAKHVGHEECDCLPACTSVTYNLENSRADLNWPEIFQVDETGANLTGVLLFFKEIQFVTSERNELYGPAAFLANCGGLLALCMGFSILSVIEIIYFVSLRLMCNVKRYGHYWSELSEPPEDDCYKHKK